MQQAGNLRKRPRRIVAKIRGPLAIAGEPLVNSSGHVALRISSIDTEEYRKYSSRSHRNRVTRDARFHIADNQIGMLDEQSSHYGIKNKFNSAGTDDDDAVPSHFLSKRIIQRLKELVLFGAIFGLLPWKWNNDMYKIEKRNESYRKFWRILLYVTTIQSSVLACFQLHGFVGNFYVENSSNRRAFMGCFGLLWNVYNVAKNLVVYIYEERMREYVNKMLQLNQHCSERYLIHLDDYKYRGTVTVHPLFYLVHLAQVASSVSLFVRKPFLKQYVFSLVYPKPLYWLIPGAFHQLLLMGQVVIYLLLVSWMVLAHTNTLRFWLSEVHNANNSGYTRDELREPQNALRTYKALQTLNRFFNESGSPLAIPVAKYTWGSALIPCGYVLIRSMNHFFIDDFPAILSYPVGVINTAVKAYVLLSMSAEVSDLGFSFLQSWSHTEDKHFRRILMSCPTLNVWTRRFYFISISTLITYFQQVSNIIIDCIITFQ